MAKFSATQIAALARVFGRSEAEIKAEVNPATTEQPRKCAVYLTRAQEFLLRQQNPTIRIEVWNGSAKSLLSASEVKSLGLDPTLYGVEA